MVFPAINLHLVLGISQLATFDYQRVTDVTTSRQNGFRQHNWGLNQQQLVIKLAWMGLN